VASYRLYRKVKNNSRYYSLALGLWREYMPSVSTPMTYDSFERLMNQRPSEMEHTEEIWNDLLEKGNLVL